jgi:sn-glycerol 3-phosphate transport system ATP-binding protein
MNLIAGRVEREAGRIVFGDGQWIGLDRRRFPDIADGLVTVGVRAETIVVDDDPAGLAATFDFAEEMGAAQLIHAEIAGTSVVAHVPGDRHYAPRAGLRYHIGAGDVHLFDAETGRRRAERLGEAGRSERPAVLQPVG